MTSFSGVKHVSSLRKPFSTTKNKIIILRQILSIH
eukprot:UN14564